MRGRQSHQGSMFSYVSLEERVPAKHPLRVSNDFRNWTGDDTRNWTLERHSVFSVTAGAGFVLSRPARRFSRSR
ncbi:hypothetical protein J2852_006204 [Azospirillum soli]|nr:hypothetical protein [Azospirillum soli]